MTNTARFLLPIVVAAFCVLGLALVWVANAPYAMLIATFSLAVAVEKIWRDYLNRKEQS